MKPSPQRTISIIIATFAILIPLIVMIWNLTLGGLLLMLGAYTAYRAIVFSRQNDWMNGSDTVLSKLERHKIEQSRTILVQLVDDFGRDLPASKIQVLMDEAHAKAGPRDTVIGVRFKVSKKP